MSQNEAALIDAEKLAKIAAELKKSKALRRTVRSHTTSLIGSLHKLKDETELNQEGIADAMELLQLKGLSLQELDAKIYELMDQATDDELKVEFEGVEKYKTEIALLQNQVKRRLKKAGINEDTASECSTTSLDVQKEIAANFSNIFSSVHESSRLPPLVITKFDGDVTEWTGFWTQFEATMERKKISKVEKFAYLKSYLTGPALKILKGMKPSESNYDEAIEMLKSRFGRDDLVAHTHMKKLLALEPVRSTSDLVGLRKLYDECEVNIRSLRSLGIDTAVNGTFLCPKLLGCLPREIRLEYTKERGRAAEWDLDALINYIRMEVENRETCDMLGESQGHSHGESEFRENKFKQKQRKFDSKPRNNSNQASAAVLSAQFVPRTTFCIFCKVNGHPTSNCTNFNLEEKKQMVLQAERCYICLRYGHQASACTSRFNSCKICKQKHNAAICEQNQVNKKKENKERTPIEINSQLVSCQDTISKKLEINSQMVTFKNTVLLQTANAYAKNPYSGAKDQVSCLLDPGSQASFVKEDVSRRLKLPIVGECEILIRNFGNQNPTEAKRNIVKVTLTNVRNTSEDVEILAVEVPYICEEIAMTEENKTIQEIKRQLKENGYHLANETDEPKAKNSTEVLIGGDCYWQFSTGKIERFTENLVAVETILGWTIQGPVNLGGVAVGSYSINVMKISMYEKEISKTLKSFFDLEAMGITQGDDPTDKEIFQTFHKDIKIEKGRYVVKFPWIKNKEQLPDNFSVAKKRFEGLNRRFQREPQLYSAYKEIIEEQIKEGVAEIVNDPENKKDGTYYLPHQPVKRESTTTKLRVVFDASSHINGAPSLNDCLASGENLNPDLLRLLLKFRINKIAIVADIKKAFLQISLDQEDRDAVRFLWTIEDENGKINANRYKTLRMARVPFGITSSPYLLAATVKTHIKKYEQTDPEVFEVLNESLYVDDLVGGNADEESAYQLSRSAARIMKEASMELRKWQTNSDDLRNKWAQDTADPTSTMKFFGEEVAKNQKILGLVWNPKKDTLSIDLDNLIKISKDVNKTKRGVLSTVSQIFDPVGFLAPYTIRAKMMMQNLWEAGLKWDEVLNEEISTRFEKWCAEMEILKLIEVPRCYFSEKIQNKELHCFTDASQSAYAAVVYIRYITARQEIKVNFVTSKSRVAPVKKLKLPKLELMGCLLGARLINNVAKIFKEEMPIKMWTDSTAALHWVKSPAKNWKPFVQNRAAEIQGLVDPENWSHCPGKTNPADLPTRGVTAQELKASELWWNGPSWLRKNNSEWPENKYLEPKIADVELERRKLVLVVEIEPVIGIQNIVDISRHNSINKTLRIIAYVYRYIERLRKQNSSSGPITTEELIKAEIKLIKDVQNSDYGEEIKALKDNKPLPKSSKIATLKPKLNEQEVICLGGRISESDFSFETKHPIIINKEQKLAQLLMTRSHEEIKHEGIQATLTQARERYWFTAGRQLARNVVRYCYKCKKYNAKPCDAESGLLPKERITESPPFSVVGIDFAGPLMVKVGGNVEKAYICLFTCGVTRAIHLELVPSMNTYEFLMAVRRMISRRGIPTVIYSDNAKTFIKAKENLNQMWKQIKSDEVLQFFGSKGIQWKFIVEKAPWWGGYYERLVKSTKTILRKNLGKASLTYQEMETMLHEAEAVINSRPITYVYNDANEPEPLTPAHLLIGKRVTCLPPQNSKMILFPQTQKEFAKRLRYRVTLMERLFKKWKQEYLLQLRTAHHIRLAKNQRKVEKGDVMIVQEDMTPKHMWKLGLVTEVMEGRDGKVRSCMVKMGNGSVIRRPIQLLYALELNNENNNV